MKPIWSWQDGSLGESVCPEKRQAEFPPQHLRKGKRRASTPQNCPVSSMYVAWHVQDLSQNDKPLKLNSKVFLKYKRIDGRK